MNLRELSDALTTAATGQIQRIVSYVPNIAVALLLLGAGWLFARLVRTLAFRITVAALERIARRGIIERGLSHGSLQTRIPVLVREAAFWAVMLAFVAAAMERLEIPALSSPMTALTFYAPMLLTGMLIAVLGFVAANIARDWTTTALMPIGATQALVLGRVAQVATLATALVMAADQVGIRSTILMLALGIVLTVTLGAVALAFSIGCAPMVGNLIASHYVAKRLSKGQTARLGDHTGVVAEITAAFVVLATAEGEILIPAKRFMEECTVIADPETN
ncbi:MAG: hypothetical protein R2762_20550 [Bryobacteraceae bacterium]